MEGWDSGSTGVHEKGGASTDDGRFSLSINQQLASYQSITIDNFDKKNAFHSIPFHSILIRSVLNTF